MHWHELRIIARRSGGRIDAETLRFLYFDGHIVYALLLQARRRADAADVAASAYTSRASTLRFS